MFSNDSVLAETDTLLFVHQNDLAQYWEAVDRVRPRFEKGNTYAMGKSCIRVGFIIESDGSVSTVKRRTEVPADRMWRPLRAALPKWRYKPGPMNPEAEAVYTEMTFTMLVNVTGESGEDEREKLFNLCAQDPGQNQSSQIQGN